MKNKAITDGVELTSIDHPACWDVGRVDDPNGDISRYALNCANVEHVKVEVDERWILSLEERLSLDKPLFVGDVVKICDIAHVWMGDGFVALKYSQELKFAIECAGG